MSLYMIVGERLDHVIKERMHKETKKRHGSEGTNEWLKDDCFDVIFIKLSDGYWSDWGNFKYDI